MITEVSLGQTPFTKTQTSTGQSQKQYFFNSSPKLNLLTTISGQQSLSYLKQNTLGTLTTTPNESYSKKTEQYFYLTHSCMELYDEYESNYKFLQQIKTSLDVTYQERTTDIKGLLQSSRQITPQQQIQTSMSSLEFCDLDQVKQKVQINRFKFYYFRTSIFKRQSPIIFTISFNTQLQLNQLKVYLSIIHEFPTKFNAEYNLTSNFVKIYANEQDNFFKEQYLYITLYTELDSQVTLSIHFGQKMITKQFPKEISEQKKRKLPDLNTIIKTDLIKRNLDTTNFSINKRGDLLASLFTEREMKRKQVYSKKQVIDQEQKLQKRALYNASLMRSNYRFYEQVFKRKVQKVQYKQLLWFQILNIIDFASEFKKKLQQFKRAFSNKANGRLIALQYGLILMINVKKFGTNPQNRAFCKSLLTLQMYAAEIKKTQKLKASKIITSFIQECVLIIHLQHRLIKTRDYVILMQNKFRHYKKLRTKFFEEYWLMINQNYRSIIKSLLVNQNQKLRTKSQKQISVYQIDNYQMQMQIDNFFERQKQIWLNFIRNKIQKQQLDHYLNDRKSDGIRKLLINFQEPTLFKPPHISDINEIIEMYAKSKRII